MDFDPSIDDDTLVVALRTREFTDESVIPLEGEAMTSPHGPSVDIRARLQSVASSVKVFAPTSPKEFGGLGLNHRSASIVLEESGRSLLGPAAMNCAAPDEGNIAMLDRIASADQKRRYLAPLCTGEFRSTYQ